MESIGLHSTVSSGYVSLPVEAWDCELTYRLSSAAEFNVTTFNLEIELPSPHWNCIMQGHWSLTPVSAEAYDRLSAERRPQEPWERELLANRADGACKPGPGRTMKTLMYLEQDVGPAAARKVPPVFHGILRRMCAAAAAEVFKVAPPYITLALSSVHILYMGSSQRLAS